MGANCTSVTKLVQLLLQCNVDFYSVMWSLQALRLWPKPVPGSLYHLAATLQPEGLPLCCKAVHVEPWRSSYHELLQVLAA